MSDVNYWDDLYSTRLDELNDLIEAHKPEESLSAPSLQTLAQAKSILQQIENARKSYKLDMRALPRNQQGEYIERLKEHEARLHALKESVKAMESQVNQSELTQDDRNPQGNDEILRKAEDVSDKTTRTLGKILETVGETEEVAIATEQELERQAEQLQDIQTKMLTMQGNLKYADQLIRNFTKRMMTDKFVMAFLFLNIVAVIGIIIYVFLEKKTDVLSSDKDDAVAVDDNVLDDGSRRFVRGWRFGNHIVNVKISTILEVEQEGGNHQLNCFGVSDEIWITYPIRSSNATFVQSTSWSMMNLNQQPNFEVLGIDKVILISNADWEDNVLSGRGV